MERKPRQTLNRKEGGGGKKKNSFLRQNYRKNESPITSSRGKKKKIGRNRTRNCKGREKKGRRSAPWLKRKGKWEFLLALGKGGKV